MRFAADDSAVAGLPDATDDKQTQADDKQTQADDTQTQADDAAWWHDDSAQWPSSSSAGWWESCWTEEGRYWRGNSGRYGSRGGLKNNPKVKWFSQKAVAERIGPDYLAWWLSVNPKPQKKP